MQRKGLVAFFVRFGSLSTSSFKMILVDFIITKAGLIKKSICGNI